MSNVLEINTITADYTTNREEQIRVDTTANAITLTLSDIDTFSGNTLSVIDIGENLATNNLTITTEGTGTIDGHDQIVLTTNGDLLKLECDGTNWFTDRRRDFETVKSGSIDTDELNSTYHRVPAGSSASEINSIIS
ncbi:MAG: hypothetical protein ABEI98_03655, partial [Halorhabdus sp.]